MDDESFDGGNASKIPRDGRCVYDLGSGFMSKTHDSEDLKPNPTVDLDLGQVDTPLNRVVEMNLDKDFGRINAN